VEKRSSLFCLDANDDEKGFFLSLTGKHKVLIYRSQQFNEKKILSKVLVTSGLCCKTLYSRNQSCILGPMLSNFFVPAKPFKPDLMFVGKASSLP
jgi:hypothetical protein